MPLDQVKLGLNIGPNSEKIVFMYLIQKSVTFLSRVILNTLEFIFTSSVRVSGDSNVLFCEVFYLKLKRSTTKISTAYIK